MVIYKNYIYTNNSILILIIIQYENQFFNKIYSLRLTLFNNLIFLISEVTVDQNLKNLVDSFTK